MLEKIDPTDRLDCYAALWFVTNAMHGSITMWRAWLQNPAAIAQSRPVAARSRRA